MKLYHASTVVIEHPDTKHSRDKLDFGRGFYLTKLKRQAVSYAQRFIVRGKTAYINVYEMDDVITEFTIKRFPSYNEEWLDYVSLCRKGEQPQQRYDAVSGGIANDKVFNTLDLFFAGIISKQEALGRLRYEKPNHQICILNEVMLNRHLHFLYAKQL